MRLSILYKGQFGLFIRRGLYKLLQWFSHCYPISPSATKIDVIIPLVEKDLHILPLCLEGIRKNVLHTIDSIYIVAPKSKKIKTFCDDNQLIYINENQVLGYGAQDVNFITDDGTNRSGWIFQQLLKLSASIGKNPYYLVIDADHILLKPHVFITQKEKYVFYQSLECHLPYYYNIQSILGYFPSTFLSYVTHKMIFNRKDVIEMQKRIEERHSGKWDTIIINSLDKNEKSPFSEYELFGSYIPYKRKILLPWKQITLKYTDIDSFVNLQVKYPNYMSATFPEWFSTNT